MDDLSSKDRELVKNKDEEGTKNEDVDEYRGMQRFCRDFESFKIIVIIFKIVNKWKK